MDAETRKLALRQAAKMVLGVAFVGCGGAIAAEAAPDGASDAKTGGYDAAVAVPKDAGLACNLTPEGDAGISESSVACCFALTESATPDAGFAFDPAPWASNPSLSGCCTALYEKGHHSLVSFAYGKEPHWRYDTCGACAKLVGDPSACTPWGPPVPPAMLGVA